MKHGRTNLVISCGFNLPREAPTSGRYVRDLVHLIIASEALRVLVDSCSLSGALKSGKVCAVLEI
jgi:hypothetical protein